MSNGQKAVWVVIGLLLVALSVTVLWQVQAISRLQEGASQRNPGVAPVFRSESFGLSQPDWLSASGWRIANLERQVEEDRWEAERQRRSDEDERRAEEWERERQERWK